MSKCCVRDSNNMIYGPWNGNISNFTWRVPWSRCIPSIHPQNMSTCLYSEKTSDQWKLKGSNWIMFLAISRTDCDFSVHTNSLHIVSARSQPWFIDSENEWKKNRRIKEKNLKLALTTMKKVVKWINVRIGNSLIDKNSTVSMSDGMKRMFPVH